MAAFESLAVKPGIAPMEAKLVDDLPEGEGWRYEPKWDGFRCLVFRDGDAVELRSKSGKALGRYFPEMVETVRAMAARRFERSMSTCPASQRYQPMKGTQRSWLLAT